MPNQWGNAKPIPTLYASYQFRSRLEARWARFLDALDISWEYEPEGFDLDGLYYLPDFWLPSLDCWLEIKPVEPNTDEREKAERLTKATGKITYIFYGDLRPETTIGEMFDPLGWDNFYRWCECPRCHRIGMTFGGESDTLSCGCDASDFHYASPRLCAAYQLARTTRFGT